jgi:hypothetical protein
LRDLILIFISPPMKAESQFVSSSFTALILKLTGVVLVLGALVDGLVLAVPPKFLDNGWVADLISGWVDRAMIPLLGLAILLLGVWIGRGAKSDAEQTSLKGLPLAAIFFSGLLGLLFLLITPLYFTNSRAASAADTRKINQEAVASERQLDTILQQKRAQVTALLSDDKQLAQLQQQIDSAKLPAEQQAKLKQLEETLKQVQADPKRLDEEVEKARSQGLKQIQEKQKQDLAQAQAKMNKNRLYTTLNGLLYAIGYLIIAWAGMRVSAGQKSKKKARAR